MPELPEVETTVRGLAQVLEGQRLIEVDVRRPDLRWPLPPDLRQRLTGATVTQLGRRSKYGLVYTDRDDVLIFHLGMSGRWLVNKPDAKHDHVVLTTAAGNRAVLNDPRRFGSLDLMPRPELASYRGFVGMGPEPLGEGFSAAHLAGALAGRRAPIKALLLDQRVVAGLGNIYVCEALNMAGVHPQRLGAAVTPDEAARLVTAVRDVLTAAIAAGGSTLRDYAAPSGERGYFFTKWRVYGRAGKACRCGAPIQRIVQSGRSSFFCAVCQT